MGRVVFSELMGIVNARSEGGFSFGVALVFSAFGIAGVCSRAATNRFLLRKFMLSLSTEALFWPAVEAPNLTVASRHGVFKGVFGSNNGSVLVLIILLSGKVLARDSLSCGSSGVFFNDV